MCASAPNPEFHLEHFLGEETPPLMHRSQGTPAWSCLGLPLCQFPFLTPENSSISFIL